MKIFRILFSLLLTGAIFLFGIKPALAFCGFYVAKADSSLYNQASQVIIARDGRRTVLTMSNDYQGEVKYFAMVIPVPVVLTKEQVHIADSKIIDRLDAFSAPRLGEAFEDHPCISLSKYGALGSIRFPREALKTIVEKQFSIGEYDILILNARESDNLEAWLIQNDYQVDKYTKKLLESYIHQGMKFLVAKVNLTEYNKNTYKRLRPISIAYESNEFVLPIRLGMSNAKNEQDLIVYLLSPQGQIELSNYRTVKIPTFKVPEFVKTEFTDFYQAVFQKEYEEQNKQIAFLEYASDWGSSHKCFFCSADESLTSEELKQAGVFWLDRYSKLANSGVFITRLHIRYTRDRFPEDLVFQQTNNKRKFQATYIVSHPFRGEIPEEIDCSASSIERYKQKIKKQQQEEVKNLEVYTNWNIQEIRRKMKEYKFKS